MYLTIIEMQVVLKLRRTGLQTGVKCTEVSLAHVRAADASSYRHCHDSFIVYVEKNYKKLF